MEYKIYINKSNKQMIFFGITLIRYGLSKKLYKSSNKNIWRI